MRSPSRIGVDDGRDGLAGVAAGPGLGVDHDHGGIGTEDDLLDRAWGLTPVSRLSCQARVGDTNLVIEIPKYTINYAKEAGR